MRSRNAKAAALYQSCLVAMPASLPIARRSLARMALLIYDSANSSIGWCGAGEFAGCVDSGKIQNPRQTARNAAHTENETQQNAVPYACTVFMQGPGRVPFELAAERASSSRPRLLFDRTNSLFFFFFCCCCCF